MTGRHRKRRAARAQIPARRRLGIEVVDAVTKLAHQVSPEKLATGRAEGSYQGFCGAYFPAASMVEPGCGPCQPCRERARS
ncbi:MAG TPA: hypothetical protein VFO16_13330 [Pseudonocardiaceae bacterium]|nr:hypothetical protein [Pseudonocardiaceae bacterium]